MLQVRNLVKTYKSKNTETVYALNDVSLDFPEKGMVFLLGKSGSGKSTLLNTIGGLDKFDSGEIIIKGKSSKSFSQSDFDSYRNTFVGFIFQEYNILENFTVAKNLALALELQGKKAKKEDVNNLLSQVDMLSYANRKPNQLSGGQKQRVAIARALIKNPEIIMADEPTGALDSATGKQVMDTLKNLSKEKLIIVVSHDREFAEIYGDRIIELKDGKVISDTTKKEIPTQETPSGMKIIDGNLLYIKKGQDLSNDELKSIAQIIKKNTQNSDMFLSFDKGANEKLKEGAKINDSGNKESFVSTTKEDIDQKTYNGKDLKLIRSKLKFTDSFKMGASSLKSKVAKLVITIILSVFAFSMFGIIDTLANWNRGVSVYDSLKKQNVSTISLNKSIKDSDNYFSETSFTSEDIKIISEKFPNYKFLSLIGDENSFSSRYVSIPGKSLNSTKCPADYFTYSSFATITMDDVRALNFELEGSLPTTDTEIVITRYNWENAKKLDSTNTLTDWHGLTLNVESKTYDIVGILDERSNFDKYKNKTEAELGYQNAYNLGNYFKTCSAFTMFVNEDRLNQIKLNSNYTPYINMESGGEHVNSSRLNNGIYSLDYMVNKQHLTKDKLNVYTKSGDTIELNDDEIIASSYTFNRMEYDEVVQMVKDGTLYLNFSINYGAESLGSYKVVGLTTEYKWIMSNNKFDELSNRFMEGCSYLLTSLKNTAEDQKLIEYCEKTHGNVKYPVSTDANSTFDMLEEIITLCKTVFIYIAIGFAVFTSLLLMNFIATSINYKKREIGVLRALGARGKDVFGIFFNESTIIAFINFALASIITFIACTIINNALIAKLGVTIVLLNFGIKQLALLLAISWGSAFLASLIPTMKISNKKPIDAIQNR